MVAPTYGPTTELRTNNLDAVGSYYDKRVKYRQTKPYNLALPYTREKYVTVSGVINPPWYSGGMADAGSSSEGKVGPYFFDNLDTTFGPLAQARNLAVEKYRSKRSESADFLTTLIQRKQAMSMIATRSLQLLTLAVAIASKDYRKIGRAMGVLKATMPSRKTWRKTSKGFASAWLEYSYGWVPLVKDIGSAVTLLETPINAISIRERAKWVEFKKTVVKLQNDHEFHGYSYSGTVSVQVGCRLSVDNPNLYMASQLGFTNPLATAWELVPFSFVVDWFVPVQGFLQNFNSSHGLTEGDAYHTIYWKATGTTQDWVTPPYVPVHRVVSTTGLKVQRIKGIPDMSLVQRAPWQLSSWRAANAISLLVGFLKTKA